MSDINMQLFLFFCALFFLHSSIDCTQNLYKLVPEHCEITNINDSLVLFHIRKCFKLSRLELFLNASFSFHQNITSNDMGQVMITGYQFRSNEYRKGPIEFMLGLCSAMTSKDFDIPHMFSNSNTRCPFIKDREYHVYKLSPNGTNMPPFIPEGRWMIQLDFMYMNKYTIFSVKWFTGVEYPILLGLH